MYRQDANLFIGARMAPPKPTGTISDQYTVYTRADLSRDQMAVRAPGAESAGGGWNVTYSTFTCIPYSLHVDIPDQDRANADAQFDLDRDATIFLTEQGLIKLDRVWATTAFTTSVWTGSTTQTDIVGGSGGVTKFSVAGSTPIETIRAQVINLQLAGLDPMKLKLCMGPLVWQTLADHPELIARIKVTEDRIVQTQLLAALLGIGEVVVGWGSYNSVVEGGTAAYNFILGNNMLLAYVQPPGLLTPTSSVTFYWQGYLGSAALGPAEMGGTASIRKFRLERNRVDRVEIEEAFVPQITAPDLGVFFSNIV